MRRIDDAAWFARDTLEVARDLVGCVLRRGSRAGRIVEVEAYTDDAASHFVTRGPSAGELMGHTHGLAYVYAIYGVHLCLNVTTDAAGPGAVLLRAIEPLEGLAVMRRARSGAADPELCRGPGNLARALGVTRAMSGRPFLEVFELLDDGPARAALAVVTGPRVGIRADVHLPWRFSVSGCPHVSRPRPPAMSA